MDNNRKQEILLTARGVPPLAPQSEILAWLDASRNSHRGCALGRGNLNLTPQNCFIQP